MSVPHPQRWQELSAYLDQALELPSSERAAWLDEIRSGDPSIADELASLLADHELLDRRRFLEASPAPLLLHPLEAGQRIGAYLLVRPIGEGGMGTIWLAERDDGRFHRPAAIKFLSVALAARGQERFRREGSFLARLSHPHIAQLLDAGITEAGQPYLVLEHIQGEPIDQFCDRRSLSLDARLTLFLDVLSAVSHAHANLIVHRDLKPSNVLVNRDGQAKLLDFGIAKLLEKESDAEPSTLTGEGGPALTPQYAAPEQLSGAGITTATDVYAIGVLLYVLLTGQHPAGPGPFTTAHLVKFTIETDPRRLSEVVVRGADASVLRSHASLRATTPDKLSRTLRGDLEIIVAKALKKAPGERYASVAALADDISRYLRQQPITARADTLRYRAAKFVRRHRAAVALAGVAMIAVIGGVVGTLIQARNARAQRDYALREFARAEAVNDLNQFVLSDAAPSGKPFTVDDLLARAERIVARQHADPLTQIDLLISIGHQYTVQEEYTKARAILENAYQRAQDVPDLSTRADAACTLGQVLANVGELQRAETLFQQGLNALPDTSAYALDRYSCLLRGAEIAQNRNDSANAVSRAEAAASALRLAPLRSELAETDAQIGLADAYRIAGRMQDSITAFRRAADELTAMGRGNTARAATVYNNLGVTLDVLGRAREAEITLRHALDISRDSSSEQALSPMLLINYARALADLERLPEAASLTAQGVAGARESGNRVALDQGLLLQSSIFRKQGDFASAGRVLQQVEPDLRHLPAGHIAHAALDSLQALLADALGDRQAALGFANDSVRIADAAMKRGGAAYYVQLYLTRRAQIELELGHTANAIADASRVVNSLSDPAILSSYTGDAYMVLGRAYQQQGRAADAASAFRSALANFTDALGPDHPSTVAARQLAGSK